MNTKRRFITLAVIVVTLMVGGIVYSLIEGTTYTDVRSLFFHTDTEGITITAVPEDEGIVEVTDAYFNEVGNPCVSFRSIGKGYVDVKVFYNGVFTYTLPLYVNNWGTIFERGGLTFDGFVIVEIGILISLGLIVLVLVYTFFECFAKLKFSYNMVAYGGIALFCLAVITVNIVGMQWNNTFYNFISYALETGYLFAFVSAPFVLTLCALIAFSNIWLLRHEGFRPHNALGIVLGVFWFLSLLGVLFLSQVLLRMMDFDVAKNIMYCIGYIISFMACMLLSTVVCAFLAAKRRAKYDKDYIIILGCCIRPDGTPTPILKGRVDAAIKFEREQFEKTGKHAKFVPSGGQGSDEVISESESMKRYLIEQGYPEEQIVKEDKSVNTDQNIRFSRDRILEDAGTIENIKVGVATTNYHIFRSYVLAEKHGLDAQGISAKTKWYFFPNAFLREFAGLLVDRKWNIILILLGVIAAYIISSTLLALA